MWLGFGCAGTGEELVREDLAAYRERLYREPTQGALQSNTSGQSERAGQAEPNSRKMQHAPDGRLARYLALAMARQPALAAAFARFEASVARISRARRLPEPTLSFGYFLQSVETRVGPQRARLSLQQSFPWPTKLLAGADAASAQARAAQRRFEAQSLAVTARVATVYWDLWQVRRTRTIHREHLSVLQSLSEAVNARLATGAVSLAEQQQVDLAAARLQDAIAGMDESEWAAQARLRAAVGLPEGTPFLTLATVDDPPPACLPEAAEASLKERALEHPFIAAFGSAAEAHEASARMEAADRLPSFTVGADWILTGEAAMSGVQDSGKDALMVGVGLRLPIFQGSYSESVEAAEADGRAERKSQQAAADQALAELQLALSALRDAVRRVELHEYTLLPQAEAAYRSVLGAYTTNRGSVAQLLLAQRDLLELNIALQQARADHARAWSRLEQVVGQHLGHGQVCDGGEGNHLRPGGGGSLEDTKATEAKENGHG